MQKPSVLAIVTLAASAACAGTLTPPMGPITPTPGPEPRIAINATNTPGDADSFFRISQPGSYYLTGNMTGINGAHGIEIATSGVTLDLNGFELLGAAGSLDGVSVTEMTRTNIAVVNGSVRSWGGDGIDLGSSSARNCRVEGVLATGNGSQGIRTGLSSTVSNCVAAENTQNGILTGNGCTVANCTAYSNIIHGIFAGQNSMVSDCKAWSNTLDGIRTNGGCTVSNCTAHSNQMNGINASSASNTVVNCSVSFNSIDGIVCGDTCLISGNNCFSNGNLGNGAGIHATGGRCRIEGNNCSGADRGIDVDIFGSFVARNTCTSNTTNWDVVAGNVCLVVQGVGGAAILGNTGGGAPGSTDPNANFSY